MRHALFADEHQGLVDDQDRVVDDGPNQDDEAEHREGVERLVREEAQQPQPRETAHRRHGDAHHDDQRVEERFVERGNQQIGDHNRQQQATRERLTHLFQLVGGSRQVKMIEAVGKQATLAEVVKDFPVDPLHRFFQRDLRTWFDLNRDRPLAVDPVDLLWAAAELQVGHGAERHHFA